MGVESTLRLQGWTMQRRVVVLRRKVAARDKEAAPESDQLGLPGLELDDARDEKWEHAVLVTSWKETEVLSIAQMYRDRGDAENMFDELKNQWGWTGFTTKNHKRSQLMARIVALIFNWWSLFTRIGTPKIHRGIDHPPAVSIWPGPPHPQRQSEFPHHLKRPCPGAESSQVTHRD